MRAYLNLEKHHIEILLEIVEEEVANSTVNRSHKTVRYLAVVLRDTLQALQKDIL